MGRITSDVGLITGIPITQTVNQLMALQARPRDLIISRNKALQEQQVALTDLNAALAAFQFTALNLGKADLFKQKSVTSSVPATLAASSTGQPTVGTYQFTPLATVQSQQLLSSGFASDATPLGAGDVTFGFGGFVDADVSLDALNGGTGVKRGKLRITDRSGADAEIDLRTARTVGDVLRAVNENSTVNVRLEVHGDRFRLVDLTGQTTVNLQVQESGGTTAASLGLSGVNVAATSANGQDVVRLFNQLDLNRLNDGRGVRFNEYLPDVQVSFRDGSSPLSIDFRKLAVTGTFASGTTNSVNGLHAEVKVTAKTAGSAYDGVAIAFQDDAGVTAGNETVEYDEDAKTLIFKIDAGASTANNIVAALNADDVASELFEGALSSGSSGGGLIDAADTATTSGGGVIEPVPAGSESTIAAVLATINAADPARLRAEIAPDGDRLLLTDLTSGGGTFAVTALNGSKALEDLGLATSSSGATVTGRRILSGLNDTLLASLNGGQGLGTLGVISLTDRSGATANVNLAAADTLSGVIDLLNASGLGISASINAARNGIQLVDTTGLTASNLIAANGDGTNAATKFKLAGSVAGTKINSGTLNRQTVSENTKLLALNGGLGVSRSTFKITSTNGASATIDLADADLETIGDVIDEINARNIGVTARINDAGDGLLLVDAAAGTGTLAVTEGNSTTAADLHLLGGVETIDIGGTPTKVIDGSTTFTVTLSATDTLSSLVTKINDLAAGVSASSFSDGSTVNPFRLTLLSQRAGTRGEILLDASAIPDLAFEETSRAQDAVLLLGPPSNAATGVLVSSSTGSFKDVVPGLNLQALATSETAVSVTVATTDSGLVGGVQAFVDNFNRLRAKIETYTAFNADTNERGTLLGDSNVLRIDADLSRFLSGRFFGVGGIQSLETLGVSLKDDGTLAFDSAKLKAKFAADPEGVRDFFTKETTGFSAKLDGLLDQLAGEDNSLLSSRLTALERKIAVNEERVTILNVRLDLSRERLLAKFFALETTISKIQSNLASINSIQGFATVNTSLNSSSV